MFKQSNKPGEIIDIANLERKISNVYKIMECQATFGHKFAYTTKESYCESPLFFKFTCQVCGLNIWKQEKHLTPDEIQALKTLKIINEQIKGMD